MTFDHGNGPGRGTKKFDPETLVAYLLSLGMRHTKIADLVALLGTEGKLRGPAMVSRLKARAEEIDILRLEFDVTAIPEHVLHDLRHQITHGLHVDLYGSLHARSRGALLDLRVIEGLTTEPRAGSWDLHLRRFTRNAAWYVRAQLDLAQGPIGVSWGRTVSSVCDAVARDERIGHKRSNLGQRVIEVLPTVGDPLGSMPADDTVSSTQIARRLSETLCGTSRSVPSLEGIAPVLPRHFTEGELKVVKRYFSMLRGYRHVFGYADERVTVEGALARADTLLTSVGSLHAWKEFASPRMVKQDGLVSVDSLQREAGVAGDIGGVLLTANAAGLSPGTNRAFDELGKLWTGISLEDFRRVATLAKEDANAPGVIVVAAGANKARVVDLVVSLGLVNRLVVDQHLANKLKSIQPAKPSTSEWGPPARSD